MTVRIDQHGNRDVLLTEDPGEGVAGHLRVFQTPGYEPPDPHYWPNSFHIIWWFPKDDQPYFSVGDEDEQRFIKTPDISACVDRETLTEIRDEIQRVLDSEVVEPSARLPVQGDAPREDAT